MKRKVKFRDGGEVESGPERPRRGGMIQRAQERAAAQEAVRQFNELPEVAERNQRDTNNRRRVELSEQARARDVAAREEAARAARERAMAQDAVRQFNQLPEVDAANRRPPPGRELVPYREQLPATRTENVPAVRSENMPAVRGQGAVAGAGAAARPRVDFSEIMRQGLQRGAGVYGGGRGAMLRRGAGIAADMAMRGAARLRNNPSMRMPDTTQYAEDAPEPPRRQDVTPDYGEGVTNRVPPRPQAAPQRPRSGGGGGRQELTADQLNGMVLGGEYDDAPDTPEARIARMRIRRAMEGGDNYKKGGLIKKKAGGKVHADAAMDRKLFREEYKKMERAEERKEGKEYKKGGVVKKKAGGVIKAGPKKMMKGGVVTKPKAKAKAMPFKKGGMIKGKKK